MNNPSVLYWNVCQLKLFQLSTLVNPSFSFHSTVRSTLWLSGFLTTWRVRKSKRWGLWSCDLTSQLSWLTDLAARHLLWQFCQRVVSWSIWNRAERSGRNPAEMLHQLRLGWLFSCWIPHCLEGYRWISAINSPTRVPIISWWCWSRPFPQQEDDSLHQRLSRNQGNNTRSS